MNRLKHLLGEPQEPERPDNFFEIECRHEVFAVSRETAHEVVQRLDQLPPPHWIAFADLSGSRHRVLASNASLDWVREPRGALERFEDASFPLEEEPSDVHCARQSIRDSKLGIAYVKYVSAQF